MELYFDSNECAELRSQQNKHSKPLANEWKVVFGNLNEWFRFVDCFFFGSNVVVAFGCNSDVVVDVLN